jgi:hypothetical protein
MLGGTKRPVLMLIALGRRRWRILGESFLGTKLLKAPQAVCLCFRHGGANKS